MNTKIYGIPTDREATLTEDQRCMLVHCLRMAARKFDENAGACMPPAPAEDFTPEGALGRLAEQFRHQAAQAQELADRLEQSRYIKIGANDE